MIQKVIKNDAYKTIQVVDRVDYIHNSLTNFATQIHTIQDPVLGNDITISGAGIALVIRAFAHDWIGNSYDGATNEHGDFILNG